MSALARRARRRAARMAGRWACDAPARRLADAVEHMLEAVVTIDLDGAVTAWSQGAERLYGWSAAEAVGRSVFSLIRPRLDAAGAAAHLARVLADRTHRDTAPRTRKDGTEVIVETTYVRLDADDGSAVGVLGVARDVTELVVARARLAEAEARSRAIFDAMSEGVVLRARDGALLGVNRAAERILGLDRAVLAGVASPPEGWRAVHSDGTTPLTLRAGEELFATGRETTSRAGVIHKPDGETTWVTVSARAITRGDAPAHAALITIADVTEQHRAHQRAIDVARLQSLSARMNDIELVVRPDGAIVHANDRALAAYGYDEAEITRLDIRALRAPDTLRAVGAQLATANASGVRFESVHVRKDGSTFPVEVSSRAFEVGGERYLHSLVRDLTEPRAAARALRESEERLRSIFAAMAEGVVLEDATGAFVTCNEAAERILGATREELAARWLRAPLGEPRGDGGADATDAQPPHVTRATGEPTRGVVLGLRARDGALRWISVSAEPVRAGPGEPLHAVVTTLADVTALRRAQEETTLALRRNEHLVMELQTALREVRQLSALLPICMYCKKIRDDAGEWQRVDTYIGKRTGVLFSHGMCPECADEHFPER